MRILANDESPQHQRLYPELEATLRDMLLNMQSRGYEHIVGLEAAISDFFGGCHAVAVQSGRAAMFLGLKALGIGPGDEVITPPNSDLTTNSVVSQCGARFILCDVEDDTANIDPKLIEACITPRTKAIFPVHITGHPADMDPIMAIAKRRGLAVIEDACLSLGATYHGRLTGLIGDVGTLSFGIGKVISGAGDGGMVITRDAAIADEVRLLRGVGNFPSVTDVPPAERHTIRGQISVREGYFVQMGGMEAAIVRLKLPHLPAWQAERQALADRYAGHFAGTPVRAPLVRPGCTHTWRDYIVRVARRDEVREAVHRRGIATNLRYLPPVHLQPVHKSLGLGPGSFPVAERIADELLGLPLYPGLLPEQVDEIAAAVLDAVTVRTA
jgi:dTDP-4-amino-4,6-dideoxygalactose transaminase